MCQPAHIASSAALVILVLTLLLNSTKAWGQGTFNLLAVPGGLTGTFQNNNYQITFGTMNGLGLGTPQAGLTVAQFTAPTAGALYFTEYQVQFTGLPNGHRAGLSVQVTTNFTHPAAQVVQNCPSNAACNTAAAYSAMPTAPPAAPNVVVAPGVGNNTPVTVGLGIFVPDNNGVTAFTGADNAARLKFTMIDLNTNAQVATSTLSFNGTPNQTVQDAVQLTLSTAPGGLTVALAADYSLNFGNVNGLGIGAGAGLTAVAAAGGTIYSTPYILNAAFSDFSKSTATIEVYANANFAHPAVLKLEDAAASIGPFSAISTTITAQTVITTAAADRAPLTRFLGLFVSNSNNGAGAFTGTDNATLTFTLTVP